VFLFRFCFGQFGKTLIWLRQNPKLTAAGGQPSCLLRVHGQFDPITKALVCQLWWILWTKGPGKPCLKMRQSSP